MTSAPPPVENSNRWPHRIALLLTLIVFPLIWVGGLVTTYDAGMAVPDWPNTYNFNMFAYPIRDWFFGPWDLFVEHGHRLLGSLAGLASIALVIATFWKEPRNWVRWLSVGVLGLVIVQGALGGARVLLDERFLAKAHGCLGPAFFATVVAFCVVTSRWWTDKQRDATRSELAPINRSSAMVQWSIAMLAISYVQLVVGAFLRHISVTAVPTVYQRLVVIHVLIAIFLVVGTFFQWYLSRGRQYAKTGLRGSINILVLLVLIQFCLGLCTWVVKYGWPVWFENLGFAATFVVQEKAFWQMNLITAHVAVGSLLLAFWTVHCLRCQRSLSAGWIAASKDSSHLGDTSLASKS